MLIFSVTYRLSVLGGFFFFLLLFVCWFVIRIFKEFWRMAQRETLNLQIKTYPGIAQISNSHSLKFRNKEHLQYAFYKTWYNF